MIEVAGQVSSGSGVATSHILEFADELQEIVNDSLYPGSLNVVLSKPLYLRPDAAYKFGGGERLLWRASINGVDVWIYRWDTAPLHVVEVLSPKHLRTTLGVGDGDHVMLAFAQSQVALIHPLHWLLWCALWLGRRHRFYEHKSYYRWFARSVRMMQRLRESLVRIRNSAKKLRTVFEVSRKLRAKVSRGAGLHKHDFSRIAVTQGASAGDHLFGQLQNILNYTKVSGSAYSAQNFGAGYHTFMINGRRLAGQRDPAKRLELVPVDFSGKTVLDLGCNQGGMIHELKDAVKWAVGVDYDARMINAANKIKVALSSDNCSFFVLDLQNEPLDLILDFLSADRVDICFLLSICMWLNNWREVIDFAQRISNEMVFETNGTAQQQEQQIQHLRERYHDVHVLAETSGDDPVQKNRKLLHLTRPISRPIAPVA